MNFNNPNSRRHNAFRDVYDSDRFVFYENGNKVGDTTLTYWFDNFGGSGILSIGRFGVGGYYVDGKLDDIRIYNRALDSTEIVALYH